MTSTEHSPTAESSTAFSLERLRQARERFLQGRPLSDDVPNNVVAAWRRARFYGVRHDLATAPGTDATENSALLAAARPVLDRLAATLDGGDYALLLTDERCKVLWWCGRWSPNTLHRDLSERVVGNNSAALALRTGFRAEVHGPEHFLDLWQELSCVSVPLRVPGSGRAAGTVTVVGGLRPDCVPHPGAVLAEATAAAVEAELAAAARPPERLLLDAYLRESAHGRAVLALDGRNQLVSGGAARLLSPQALAALEREAAGVWEEPAEAYNIELPDGEGRVARVTPLRTGGVLAVVEEPSELSAALSPPSHLSEKTSRRGEPDRLRKEHFNEPRLGRDKLARLAGSSVPWRHAAGRALDLAQSGQPLLLTGERGTGKTALALALLAQRDNTRPLIVDAAQAPDGELAAQCESLGAKGALTNPMLLRHTEQLAQRDVAALIALLGKHPELPLVATYTPGTAPGPCLQRLLDALAARSVVLPPLRERVDDIRELLPLLAPRPEPGQPPLTWTLDTLRALEQHSWPGNITELAHLVRAVAKQRRSSGPVRRGELPDAVRETPAARNLSPMALAERKAILGALHRHGGNKARAAASLGIGRATLYRKLRGYQGLPD
ncbi:helix-turn-helix domain-containing protein [Streptomyces sp. NBC_00316]|uniref:helix-turn-helix domain-containing protein n=1 Tax=Streptomyces sp. NBC_00316 TaxID=2975710 RepID=UPI002E2A6703|nr:helix-turn-helix domain-containing protein [Streptomyces sp. NBC_00316]